MAFVRKVKTASGATAVQIVEKRNGRRWILEHIGSAHDETELAVLVSAARQRLHGVQDDMLQFEPLRREPAGPMVEHTASQVLWGVLVGAYRTLGFDGLGDERPDRPLSCPATHASLPRPASAQPPNHAGSHIPSSLPHCGGACATTAANAAVGSSAR